MPTWPATVWSVVAANLWSVAGLAFFGWEAATLAFVAWTELVVVGLYNLPRMALARSSDDGGAGVAEKIFTLPFFVLHFGAVTAALGVGVNNLAKGLLPLLLREPFGRAWTLSTAVLLYVLSHGHSFAANTVGREEGRRVTVKRQMRAPYVRLLGTFLALLLLTIAPLPLPFVLALASLKMVLDVVLHLRERARHA